MMNTTRTRFSELLDALCDEYTAWNKANGLKLGSADEHLHDEALTEEQRAWLADFCERWDAINEALVRALHRVSPSSWNCSGGQSND